MTAIAGLICAIIVLPMATCGWIIWDQPRGQLPTTISYGPITHSSWSSGLREGCFEAIYSVSPASVSLLERNGVAVLLKGTIPKENPRNLYRGWRPTPLPFVDGSGRASSKFQVKPDARSAPFTLFAMHAAGGCDAKSVVPVSVRDLLAAPGGYYTITENAEGLIVIDPSQGSAAVLYSG